MKVQPRSADRFVANPDGGVLAVLIYGPDKGLVQERAGKLAAAVLDDPNDPFAIAEVDQAALKDTPSRLADELAALSFTGGRRVVRVREAGNWAAGALELALDAGGDNLIILEAGAMGPRDALRKLCEGADNAAALPCYADDANALQDLIVATLRELGHTIEPAALNALAQSLGADRGLSRREIEKLALYKGSDSDNGGGGGEITLADVEACTVDATSLLREDAVLAALSGDQAGLERALSQCRAAGETPIAILRTLSRHLQRLHLLADGVARGGDLDSAMRRLRPPVFFKQQATIQGQVRQWSPARLLRANELVMEAELNCKTTGMPNDAIVGQALIRIANAARLGRGR